MNKDEAESILSEIKSTCTELKNGDATILSPDPDDILSHGYQLKINVIVGSQSALCIKAIAEKNGLAISREPMKPTITIYRPSGSKLLQAKTA